MVAKMDTGLPTALSGAAEVELPADSNVFSQGDRARNYLLVRSGSVRVFARSSEGKEVVLYRVRAGEMCILTTTCLMGNSPYPAEAITESDVSALALGAREFDSLMNESSEFRGFVLQGLSQRLSQVMERFEQIMLDSVRQRLVNFLQHHADSDGLVQMTHAAIAAEIGSAREVVSRHLQSMEQKGLIQTRRGEIHLLDGLHSR